MLALNFNPSAERLTLSFVFEVERSSVGTGFGDVLTMATDDGIVPIFILFPPTDPIQRGTYSSASPNDYLIENCTE
jgi:hypothetical protein